jgi:hypothetical protein
VNSSKLLLLEMNEVPYRVLDTYQRERPTSSLSRLLARSSQYVTVTEDRLALDPWISWPTLHRGVTDETHQILHLGQILNDVDAAFPPIWRILRERGLGVGVFGSLHSSNIPPDVSQYSFYLPDYFDEKVFAHPKSLNAFQALSISMTRQSARNVTRKLPVGAFARFLATAPASGLSFRTMVDSAGHLASEALDGSRRIRRRAYQPLIMADIFFHQLRRKQPDFATFYTNHVAAAMHRYWAATFPQDYDTPLERGWIERYEGEIRFAMDKLDKILQLFITFVDTHPEYTLLVASSMGQAAIPAKKTFSFLTIANLPKFMSQLGVPPGSWEAKPAMVPCVCVVVQDGFRDRVISELASLAIGDATMKRDRRPSAPMSFDERERGFFQFYVQFDNYDGPSNAQVGDRTLALADLGLGSMAHEDGVNCTAQHIPEGSLIVYRSASSPVARTREVVSTVDIAPSILKFFGFERPRYMRGRATLLE